MSEQKKYLLACGVKEVSPLGERVAALLEDWCGGLHHVDKIASIDWANSYYITIKNREPLDTWDFDRLTRLVFLAHDHCIRVQVTSKGIGVTQIMFHPREREGSMSKRHPSLERAVAQWRHTHPVAVVPSETGTNNLSFSDALRIAKGCTDYGGGHHSDGKMDAFKHGIQTVITALEHAQADGLKDTQVAALWNMGGENT